VVAGDELAKRDHAPRRRLLERAGQIGRLVLQQIGVVGVDRQNSVTGLRMLGERFGQPCGELTERVAPRVAEPRELHRLVAPNRFDQFSAGTIGAGRDLADERRASRDTPPFMSGPMISSRCPGCRLRATRTASSPYRSSFWSGATGIDTGINT
jgi:hypothetical protein